MAVNPDWKVIRYGTDTSNRPIYMSVFMRDWWVGVLAELSFVPTIVQGAWMSMVPGGGAADSAGYHDGGGCLDVRTWSMTPAQLAEFNRVVRTRGAGGWKRDKTHGGMDEHYHLVLGADHDLSDGARQQWSLYLAGRDGLASNGPDYMWRPSPVVTKPPEDDLPYTEAELRKIIREEASAAVDDVLNVDMNANEPNGDPAFRGISLRRAVKDIYLAVRSAQKEKK